MTVTVTVTWPLPRPSPSLPLLPPAAAGVQWMLTGDADGTLVRNGASSGATAADALVTCSSAPAITDIRPKRLVT